MGDFGVCGRYTCFPRWVVWDEGYRGDDFKIVFAHDIESAGEKYAKECASRGGCEFANGHTRKVKIRKLSETEWKTFELSAKLSVVYYAKEVK